IAPTRRSWAASRGVRNTVWPSPGLRRPAIYGPALAVTRYSGIGAAFLARFGCAGGLLGLLGGKGSRLVLSGLLGRFFGVGLGFFLSFRSRLCIGLCFCLGFGLSGGGGFGVGLGLVIFAIGGRSAGRPIAVGDQEARLDRFEGRGVAFLKGDGGADAGV